MQHKALEVEELCTQDKTSPSVAEQGMQAAMGFEQLRGAEPSSAARSAELMLDETAGRNEMEEEQQLPNQPVSACMGQAWTDAVSVRRLDDDGRVLAEAACTKKLGHSLDTQLELRADADTNTIKAVSTLRSGAVAQDKQWDVFLSYRVAADEDLLKEIYWRLCHRTVPVQGGKERKLRVFWDRECLKPGERWEDGFASAICSCHLVVLVMSRGTFAMDGERYNVAQLTAESECDNVVLEYNLALELNKAKGIAIMPIFVGDRRDGQFTHFFESKCMPAIDKEVVVRKISEKVEFHLERSGGMSREMMPERKSVKEVLDATKEFQVVPLICKR